MANSQHASSGILRTMQDDINNKQGQVLVQNQSLENKQSNMPQEPIQHSPEPTPLSSATPPITPAPTPVKDSMPKPMMSPPPVSPISNKVPDPSPMPPVKQQVSSPVAPVSPVSMPEPMPKPVAPQPSTPPPVMTQPKQVPTFVPPVPPLTSPPLPAPPALPQSAPPPSPPPPVAPPSTTQEPAKNIPQQPAPLAPPDPLLPPDTTPLSMATNPPNADSLSQTPSLPPLPSAPTPPTPAPPPNPTSNLPSALSQNTASESILSKFMGPTPNNNPPTLPQSAPPPSPPPPMSNQQTPQQENIITDSLNDPLKQQDDPPYMPTNLPPDPPQNDLGDDFEGYDGDSEHRKKMLIIGAGIVALVLLVVILIVAFMLGGGDDSEPVVESESDASEQETEITTPTETDENEQTDNVSSTDQTDLSVPPSPVINSATFYPHNGIVVSDLSRQSLVQALDALAREPLGTPGSVYSIPVMRGTDDQGRAQIISTSQFFSILNINLPSTFDPTINQFMMLYAYTPTQEEEQVCRDHNAGQVTAKCPGNRLGIVIEKREVPGQGAVSMGEIFQDLKAISPIQFEPLILDDVSVPQNPAYSDVIIPFSGGQYLSSYMNLPHPATTLNISLVEDKYIIIATSRNSSSAMLEQAAIQASSSANAYIPGI